MWRPARAGAECCSGSPGRLEADGTLAVAGHGAVESLTLVSARERRQASSGWKGTDNLLSPRLSALGPSKRALSVLSAGLNALSMRKLAQELGVDPSQSPCLHPVEGRGSRSRESGADQWMRNSGSSRPTVPKNRFSGAPTISGRWSYATPSTRGTLPEGRQKTAAPARSASPHTGGLSPPQVRCHVCAKVYRVHQETHVGPCDLEAERSIQAIQAALGPRARVCQQDAAVTGPLSA